MFKHLHPYQSPLLQNQENLRHNFFGIPDGKVCANDSELFEAQNLYVAGQMQVPAPRLIQVAQIHSAKVRPVAAPWATKPPDADAMVTDQRGLALAIKTADCAPVLLCDPKAGVIAAAHAGWRGALAGILEKTVLHMTFLGAQRPDIIAAIGPCIAQDSYEVGAEFADEFLENNLFNAQFFLQPLPPKLQFDLGGFCAHQLRQAGVKACEIVPIDTFDKKNQYFSYRRALQNGESGYGRNISVISLP